MHEEHFFYFFFYYFILSFIFIYSFFFFVFVLLFDLIILSLIKSYFNCIIFYSRVTPNAFSFCKVFCLINVINTIFVSLSFSHFYSLREKNSNCCYGVENCNSNCTV